MRPSVLRPQGQACAQGILRPEKASRAEETTKGSQESHWEGSMVEKMDGGFMAFDLPTSRDCGKGQLRHYGNSPPSRQCCTRHAVPWL